MFFPPEMFGSGFSPDDGDAPGPDVDALFSSAWDVATRYHELKHRAAFKPLLKRLRKVSAEAVLRRAQEVLGSIVRPCDPGASTWADLPEGAEDVELDPETTLEEEGGWPRWGSPDHLWMSWRRQRRHALVLCVDTSLSMTGEKLALTAVALAVALLQFPRDEIGIVAFENEARVLKRLDETISVAQLVERFLEVPAQGYTHLEGGLKEALRLGRGRVAGRTRAGLTTILVSDGKYTAGRDPSYLAPRCDHLTVIKMGTERSSLDLCRDLARRGRGQLHEVDRLEDLPLAMHQVVKGVLRGRA